MADEEAALHTIDWTDLDTGRRWLSAESITFGLGLLGIGMLFLYDRLYAHMYLVFDWRVDTLEWLFLLGLLLLLAFGVIPALKRWNRTRIHLRRMMRRPSTTFAMIFLGVLFVVGMLGPVLFEPPSIRFDHSYTPPVGLSTDVNPLDCAGEITGEPFDRTCHGTWDAVLGTNHRGMPIEYLLMSGARVALYVIVFTAAFVVPIGVATGIIAGLRGGLLDNLLMGYVDIQLSIPAIIVYFIAYTYWNVSLLLLLLTFGLLSWGGIARLVRSEVLQRREEGHVLVARGLGASSFYLARRHILPNVTNTVLPAAAHLLAILILVEAGVAFLGFHDIQEFSWGATIAESTNSVFSPGLLKPEVTHLARDIWWASTFPALALGLTMLSFKLLGDGLRDSLDPRSNR